MKVGISTSCYFTKVNTEDTLPLIRNLGADRFEAFWAVCMNIKRTLPS